MGDRGDPVPGGTDERLTLRRIDMAEAGILLPHFCDTDTARRWSTSVFGSVEALMEWIGGGGGSCIWKAAIDGEPIGCILLRARRSGVAELGYLIVQEQWGRGVAREAIERVIAYGFQESGLRRIVADTDPDNPACIGALVTLGFALEGRLREEWGAHGSIRDSLVFGLLRRDWERREA